MYRVYHDELFVGYAKFERRCELTGLFSGELVESDDFDQLKILVSGFFDDLGKLNNHVDFREKMLALNLKVKTENDEEAEFIQIGLNYNEKDSATNKYIVWAGHPGISL